MSRIDYIRQLFAPENDTLRHIRESAKDDIGIYPDEGKLLQLLMTLADARKIVEIGTLSGYSTQWMADALPADGRIWTCEKDLARAQIARSNIGHDPRITLVAGNALDTLETLIPHAPFDMVFIDADKLNYARYLDWAEGHVRKGGLIIGDNTFLFDAVWNDAPIERVRETARLAMRDFNRRLADPEKYLGIMLPTTEGMTIAIKRF